ncbi:hypothetical protein B9Z55_012273 [Caenorhabditis nigoni]|uniref:Uncharacterized protein n=1 Tax=Caenorhabditis nigoni TaxID=1611254 RepID=A0A2G5TWK1_9PELO|nr:hypothetical protein B9Z55_012273 [Caenorhabditis nigoni]
MGTKLRNLEYLEIDTVVFQDANSFTNEVLKDLDWTDGDENDGRPMTVKIHGEATYTPPVIQIVKNLIRDNGMIGSIFQRFGVFENGKMNLCFCFQVWSKQIEIA